MCNELLRIQWVRPGFKLKFLFVIPAAVAFLFAGEADDDWVVLQRFLSKIYGVYTSPPSGIVTSKYTSAMLLGNGDIGIAAGNTITIQKFYYAKNDFWGTWYNSSKSRIEESILSLGALTVRSQAASVDPAAVYRMEQDILNAEVRTTMRFGQATVSIRSWTADAENIFVNELTSVSGPDVSVTIDHALPSGSAYNPASGSTGSVVWVSRESDLTGSGDFKARAAIAYTLLGASYTTRSADGSGAVTGSFTLKAGETVYIAAVIKSDAGTVGTCRSMASIRDEAAARAGAVTSAELAGLLGNHREWWKKYWLKSFVRVNDDILERYYYGALYVLGCASRTPHAAPSMWGSWITNETPGWGGRYFMNYNFPAVFYGVYSSNRIEQGAPFDEIMLRELPWARNRSRAAGYKGIDFQRSLRLFHSYQAQPAAVPIASVKNWAMLNDQKCISGFAAMPMIWHYEYTGDAVFLKDRLYPFLKEFADFWTDYLEKDASGKYVVNHSGAHEFASGADASDVNPNLDLGFIRYCFETLLSASAKLAVDAELRVRWRDILDNLSDYPLAVVGGKECFATRLGGGIDAGGQPVNMEGVVHPGDNVALCGNPRYLQIARNTISAMNSWAQPGSGSAHNGFCKVFIIAARVGWDSADLIARFKTSITALWRNNLTVFQEGGGLETCGSIEAVNSMLLQSNDQVMKLFPVWPAGSNASFKRLRAKGAFLVSADFTNGTTGPVDIVSEKGATARIRNPWPQAAPTVYETDADGAITVRAVTASVNDTLITFATEPGTRYRIFQDAHSRLNPAAPFAPDGMLTFRQFPGRGLAVSFTGHGGSEASVLFYDLSGKLVCTLYRGMPPAGESAVFVSDRTLRVTSGTYIVRGRIGASFTKQAKIAVCR